MCFETDEGYTCTIVRQYRYNATHTSWRVSRAPANVYIYYNAPVYIMDSLVKTIFALDLVCGRGAKKYKSFDDERI